MSSSRRHATRNVSANTSAASSGLSVRRRAYQAPARDAPHTSPRRRTASSWPRISTRRFISRNMSGSTAAISASTRVFSRRSPRRAPNLLAGWLLAARADPDVSDEARHALPDPRILSCVAVQEPPGRESAVGRRASRAAVQLWQPVRRKRSGPCGPRELSDWSGARANRSRDGARRGQFARPTAACGRFRPALNGR